MTELKVLQEQSKSIVERTSYRKWSRKKTNKILLMMRQWRGKERKGTYWKRKLNGLKMQSC